MTKAPMVCPTCGLAMNHHAEKLDLTLDPAEARPIDLELGGVLREVHTCPGCGGNATRTPVLPPSTKHVLSPAEWGD
jgi:ribosomal protein S27AE